MNIKTYNKFKQYLFWDVLNGLIKIAMVKEALKVKKPEKPLFFSADANHDP
jgi:hypothetical protein